MKLQLHEITPKLIEGLLEKSELDNLRALIRAEVRALSNEFKRTKLEATELLARCQIRAKRLDGLGVDHEAIAEMFEVPVKTVGAWVRSDVTVIAKG
jgi:hypothetical protein